MRTIFSLSIFGGSWAALALLGTALLGASCGPSDQPQTGSQTNWYRLCTDDTECGKLNCVCGSCVPTCENDCADVPDAACVSADQDAVLALCGGEPASSDICLANCESDSTCPEGSACSSGSCVPLPDADLGLRLDLEQRLQELVGFGCSLAYGEDAIVQHAQKDELLNAMFSDSGLDLIRLRNRFDIDSESDLSAPGEIVASARALMEQEPVLLMTSGSPPARLKANGDTYCSGNPDTCTLIQLPGGDFDYAGLASHFRDSLEAYAEVGISLDFLSIQNNVNWVPEEGNEKEACRFLPQEGTTTVSLDGADQEIRYPGYHEALLEVSEALAGLDDVPQLIGPETNTLENVADYTFNLESGMLSALACHIYDADPYSSDSSRFTEVRTLGERVGLPVFQTEMQANGLETSILIHRAFAAGGASTYLQNDFVTPNEDDAAALFFLEEDTFVARDPYFALAHHALRTAPGWTFQAAELNNEGELEDPATGIVATAFQSPSGDAVTIVLTNSTDQSVVVRLDVDTNPFADSEVTRTVFGGTDAMDNLGQLSPGRLVELPGQSTTTLALF